MFRFKTLILFLVGIVFLSFALDADAGLTRRKHNKAYGVSWDESNSSPTLARIGQGKSATAAAAMGEGLMGVQPYMRRVIIDDAGAIQYYLCATDSTDKEDCSTASDLTGGDGQVMVEIPLFWYKYTYTGTTHTWLISKEQFNGAERLQAFYKDEAWVSNRYYGVYDGIGWDNSASAYIDHANVNGTGWTGGTAIDTGNDKLSSVSGKNPITAETRPGFRDIALNRGAGWRLVDFYLNSAVQLLYLVEYASFDSQSMIGEGRTQLTGGTWVNGSYITESGLSNGDGNATNNVEYSGDADDPGAEAAYMTYRGIENLYGNIWGWIDGININNNIPYVSNIETDFADDTDTDYTRLTDTGAGGITLATGSDDYQTTLEQTKGGFLPSAVGGSDNTYITDYYHEDANWRVMFFGGGAGDAKRVGVFYISMNFLSTEFGSYGGGRISF